MALSDAAKAEIKAAIAIIREDKLYGYVRKATAGNGPTPPTSPTPPTPPGPPAPPAKPPTDPPPNPPAASRSAWWGEIMDD